MDLPWGAFGAFLLEPVRLCFSSSRPARECFRSSPVRRQLTFLATLPKNFFAALIERVAATVLHALEQCFH